MEEKKHLKLNDIEVYKIAFKRFELYTLLQFKYSKYSSNCHSRMLLSGIYNRTDSRPSADKGRLKTCGF
ncbi:hypothetical protein MNBD_IGNAVI01-1388 [hydrothermal vent metagenome]|uniref:Uncharacterized protein n=1 Tax=hydrothermal vent metagenome TaxID=652676 RepID=A0A3B1CEK4_9ZZZZ